MKHSHAILSHNVYSSDGGYAPGHSPGLGRLEGSLKMEIRGYDCRCENGRIAQADDRELIHALRLGDESAFTSLLDQYHAAMVRLALGYVPDRAAAEEVIQETWLGVIRGIDRFEGRSSLRTWIFRILINQAKTYCRREGHTIPFSELEVVCEVAEPAVEASRFLPPDHPRAPHHWRTFPQSWSEIPEERLLSHETLSQIRKAIDALPTSQREVIVLRDLEGWSAAEVCEILNLTEANQRVLLHRARSKVRRALEQYLSEE